MSKNDKCHSESGPLLGSLDDYVTETDQLLIYILGLFVTAASAALSNKPNKLHEPLMGQDCSFEHTVSLAFQKFLNRGVLSSNVSFEVNMGLL